MIIFVNPRATRPKNRRFPLSLMAIGAMLPPTVDWEIVDGNLPRQDSFARISAIVDGRAAGPDPVRIIALSVMPGPQLASAVPLSTRLKQKYPDMPIVWGGNFGSLYPEPVLDAPYVDWLIQGQGEQTFLDLLDVLDGRRDPKTVAGLSFRQADGSHWRGSERHWVGPAELPDPPYHKIDVDDYLHPTVLGRRSGVYQASIGCPFSCSFCGVIAVYGRKEKVQPPERMARHLEHLVRCHGMDSVHFYDNNFFLNEAQAREVAAALTPLGITWWCEARVDILARFSAEAWRLLQRSGLRMVFCGAESGSNEVLAKMSKGITTDQVMAVAAQTREHGIIPEFSFIFGDPDDPEREIANTLSFIARLKAANPAMELITHYYTPTPQRAGTYGNIDPLSGTPEKLDDWITPDWVNWMTHEDPDLPWMTPRLKAQVEDFRTVLESRFPSVQDVRTRPWGKAIGRALAHGRWERGDYTNPRLLRLVRKLAQRAPVDRQAYGHLREPNA